MLIMAMMTLVLLVCVNIGEHVDPGVDRAEVEMALVLDHHPQQALHLVVSFLSSRLLSV